MTAAITTARLLWSGGARDGAAGPEHLGPVPVAPSGFVLGTWVAPAVFGAPAGHAMPVLEANGKGLHLRLTIGRDGTPSAVVTGLDDAPIRLHGAPRLPALAWTAVEVVLERSRVSLRVDHLEVDATPWVQVTDGTTRPPTVVDVVVGGHGEGWYDRFIGVLGPVWSGAPTDAAPAAPANDPTDIWRVRAGAYDEDPDRPRWHFLPPRHWMNEPHGVIHHTGRHHLFYQRNELGPFWGEITWGHAVSGDLVHWTDLGHALAPWTVPCAPDGVWSGSACTDPDGQPVLFFTAGDNRDDPNQRTASARPTDPADPDLRHWAATAPITTVHPAQDALAVEGMTVLDGQFRDPYVWREGSTWFQLVGAGIEGRGGTALLYRCDDPDLTCWNFIGPLSIGDATGRPDTGVMWELPLLLPVGTGTDGRPRHALLVTPWWPEPTEHSLLHEWYWIGTWDAETATWTTDHDEPRELDHGGWFTGATASHHPDGRTLLWSITQDLLSDDEHRRRRWAGSAGWPMEISLVDDDLHVAPAREIDQLRSDAVLTAVDVHDALAVDAGPMFDLQGSAMIPPGGEITVSLRGGAAVLTLSRSERDGVDVTIRRPGSSEPGRMHRSESIALGDRAIPVRVLTDHSVIEAFVDGRPLTTRAWWSHEAANGLTVTARGGASLHATEVVRLRPAPVVEQRRPS